MKIWTKVKLKEYDKDIDILSNSMVNYLYSNGPIVDIFNKYGLKEEERKRVEEYTSSRIAGLLTLHMADDKRRIKDIINRYYHQENTHKILPEIEGYIDTKKN